MTHDPVSPPTPRNLRLATLTAALAALVLAASPAVAQQQVASDPGARPGMRYLTWPGKAERPRTSPAPYAAPSSEPGVPSGPILSMPAQPVIAAGVPTRYSARTSPGPTPATAWIANGGAPLARYAPPPAATYAAVPAPVYSTPPSYAPPYSAAYAAPVPPTTPVYAEPMPRPMAPPPVYAEPAYSAPAPALVPTPAPVAADTGPAMVEAAPTPPPPVADTPVPAAPVAPVVDPMAPRSDAPIFRLLNRGNAPPSEPMPEMAPEAEDEAPRPAPTPRPEAAPPPPPPAPAATDDRSPRRYSVHRANGQQPDRTPLPNPVMLDSMPVDLAAPPETPTVIRDANGRVQTIIPSEDPGLQ